MYADAIWPQGISIVLDTAVWAGAMTGAESAGNKITNRDNLLEACRSTIGIGAAGRVMAEVLAPASTRTTSATRLCLSRHMQEQLSAHLIAQGLEAGHAGDLARLAAEVCEHSGGSADLEGGTSAEGWLPQALVLRGHVDPEDIALLSTAEAASAIAGGPVLLITGEAGLRMAARAAADRGVAVVMTSDYASAARRTARV